MAIFNNQDPQRESNVGQFGATDESIGAYKQAAEYAKDAEYWAKISQQGIENINDLLVVVQDLYEKGELQLEEIEQLKRDFAAQDARLIQLIAQTNGVITDANNTIDKMDDKLAEVQAQLDILLAMDVSVTTLPPGTDATGNYNPQTGLISLGIPEGQPGKDGTVTDLATAPMGVPDSADFGFYVESTNSKVYRAKMSDIAKTFPAVVSVSYNGGNQKEVGDVNITKAKLGLGNVLDVPSYSKTETDDLNLPYPDVWAPLNDDLRLLAGFAPYDKLLISGQVLELPTKSLTFSRATTATYIDKSGVLQTAAINEPRFEKEGLLIEGQGTNLVPNSQSASSWRVANTTVTQASVISPDGTTDGVTRLASAGASNVPTGSAISVPISGLSIGGYCSFSVFAKADSHNLIQLRWLGGTTGVSNRYLNVDLSTGETGDNNLFYAKTISMANGWWRIMAVTSIDGDLTGNPSADPGVELISSLTDGRRPAVSLATGIGVYLYGPQLESGVSSSYIPTSGAAATRAADDCTLQRSGNDNYFGPVTFAMGVHFNGQTVPGNDANSRRGIISYYPSSTEWVFASLNSSANAVGKPMFCYASPALVGGATAVDDGLVHNMVFSSDTVNNKISTDGNIISSVAITRPTPGNVSEANRIIYLGRGAGSAIPGVRMLNGHIRNLRIWHRAFTDNQIRGVR